MEALLVNGSNGFHWRRNIAARPGRAAAETALLKGSTLRLIAFRVLCQEKGHRVAGGSIQRQKKAENASPIVA